MNRRELPKEMLTFFRINTCVGRTHKVCEECRAVRTRGRFLDSAICEQCFAVLLNARDNAKSGGAE